MDQHLNIQSLQLEAPRIKKDQVVVTSDRYRTAKTSPLIFCFEPYSFHSSQVRLQNSKLSHERIGQKDLYIFDHFFSEQEGLELRNFSEKASFSRQIFADHQSKEGGETPDRAMDNKEKWMFFSHPPQAVAELYKLLSWLSHQMEASITTLPWEMCDHDICAPAVATNRVEYKSQQSMQLGKHQDYNTEEGIAFGIPMLYAKESTLHASQFVNGAVGCPWLVSLMLYATCKDFPSNAGLGTIFCNDQGDMITCSGSQHMRFVLFEGDMLHTIEPSQLHHDPKIWRVSYVFKLIMNPKEAHQSMKQSFLELMRTTTMLSSQIR